MSDKSTDAYQDQRRFSVLRGLFAAVLPPIFVWTASFGGYIVHCGLDAATAAGAHAMLFFTLLVLPVFVIAGIFFAGGYLRWRLTVPIALGVPVGVAIVGFFFGFTQPNLECREIVL